MAAEDFERVEEKIDDIAEKLDTTSRKTEEVNKHFDELDKGLRDFNRAVKLAATSLDRFKSPLASSVASVASIAALYFEERSILKQKIDLQKEEVKKIQAKVAEAEKSKSQVAQQQSVAQAQIDLLKRRKKITDSIIAKESEIAKIKQRELSASGIGERKQIWEEERKARDGLRSMIDQQKELFEKTGGADIDVASELSKLEEKTKTLASEMDTSDSELEKLNNELKDATEQTNNFEKELSRLKSTKFYEAIGKTVDVLNKFVDQVRKTQKDFGIAGGQALKLEFSNLKESVKSMISAMRGKGTMVSAEEIKSAQMAFQDEFGGLITSEAAAELAAQAKEMGVSAESLAKARRTFLTSSMGNLSQAKAAEERTLAAFRRQGLTNKDAYQLIAQYSELYARNGARFAASFTKAAADAKKIGIDLNKVSQFGDSIIGDFEGFLEKSAELGAMGFGLDTSRLAEIAETGSDADLFNELRSQLAATGKDITKLRRSERLAIEGMFGMSIADMQRMAGETPTGAGGEETDPVEKSNSILSKILSVLEGWGTALKVIQGIISTVIAISSVLTERNTAEIARNTRNGGGGGDDIDIDGRRRPKGPRRGPGGRRGPRPRRGPRVPRRIPRGGGRFGAARGLLTRLGSYIPMGGGLSMGSSVGTAAAAGASGIAAIAGTVLTGLASGLAIGNMFNKSVKDGGSGTLGDFWNYNVGTSREEKEADERNNAFARSKGYNTMAEYLAAKRARPTAMIAPSANEIVGSTSTPQQSKTVAATPVNDEYIKRMEAKLDQVVRAIGSMQVKMDGKEVGKVLVDSSERVMVRGNQRLTGTSV